MSLAQPLTEIDYPESDGKPMGETDLHRLWMVRLYDMLSWRYRGQRVYIGSDLLVYYTKGKPKDVNIPDVFVVKDCEPGLRRTFKIWEEQRVPDAVFEVTSRSRRKDDEVCKPRTYGQIGVQELFLYDPTDEYLRPPLKGFRFERGMPVEMTPDASGALVSRGLGLLIRLHDGALLLADADTGASLQTEAEARHAAWESERAARLVAEAELRRLREELRGRGPKA